MTYLAKPRLHHPSLERNAVGYTRRDYEGKVSTLCAGCGHDSVSAAIVQAAWELDIAPHRVAKLSGIGCSSKTPDYFLGASHGFNTVHGRMPSVLTGANLANRDLLYLGGLGALGVGLADWQRLAELQAAPVGTAAKQAAPSRSGATFGRAKSCILLFLFGSPPQHETFDPKPLAAAEIHESFPCGKPLFIVGWNGNARRRTYHVPSSSCVCNK